MERMEEMSRHVNSFINTVHATLICHAWAETQEHCAMKNERELCLFSSTGLMAAQLTAVLIFYALRDKEDASRHHYSG